MILVRYRDRSGEIHIGHTVDGVTYRLPVSSLAELLAGDLATVQAHVAAGGSADREVARLLAPVDGATEVWAAGVTYLRSRDARIEESISADPYERVYRAERPELFFKSAAWRVRGPDEPVAVRADSDLDVPEPELAVVVTASGEIAGYSVCNDVSSRSIEGENPLYLPQAKTYAGSCALGPGIVPAWTVADPLGLEIELTVTREDAVAFTGRTSTRQLARQPDDLVRWLFAEQEFPAGVVLSTGTGIVPDIGFSLEAGDRVTIRIDGVGTLSNPVVRGKASLVKAEP